MSLVAEALLVVYFLALTLITFYCLTQFHLLYYYNKFHRNKKKEVLQDEEEGLKNWPFVTIQLPVFNEMYVLERLIENIAALDYPRDKVEIQVLDDSTDETVDISRRKVEELKERGIDIKLFHRVNRQGYKAGALRDAMPYAKGDYIAIFDADFLPKEDFLKRTIPHFQDPAIGVVQTRWEHINQNYSMLTQLQAMQLNVHFRVEQMGRCAGNCLLQFNGTAGVWRRATIEDAGGWEADTLTEDLDLSYRAQLKGWKIAYLEEIGSPAELPVEMNGLKSQQFRWMKGGAENVRKLLPTVWRSNALSLTQKFHATTHLLGSSVFLFVFVAAIFSVPLVFLLNETQVGTYWFSIPLAGLLSIILVYYVANVRNESNDVPMLRKSVKFLFLFPLFLALSMGLSLHNTIAVLQGYRGKKSPFIRTPKFNIKSIQDSFKKGNYTARKLPWTTIAEGFLAIYFLGGVVGAFYCDNMMFLIFHLFLTFGFATICYYSVRHLEMAN